MYVATIGVPISRRVCKSMFYIGYRQAAIKRDERPIATHPDGYGDAFTDTRHRWYTMKNFRMESARQRNHGREHEGVLSLRGRLYRSLRCPKLKGSNDFAAYSIDY